MTHESKLQKNKKIDYFFLRKFYGAGKYSSLEIIPNKIKFIGNNGSEADEFFWSVYSKNQYFCKRCNQVNLKRFFY